MRNRKSRGSTPSYRQSCFQSKTPAIMRISRACCPIRYTCAPQAVRKGAVNTVNTHIHHAQNGWRSNCNTSRLCSPDSLPPKLLARFHYCWKRTIPLSHGKIKRRCPYPGQTCEERAGKRPVLPLLFCYWRSPRGLHRLTPSNCITSCIISTSFRSWLRG